MAVPYPLKCAPSWNRALTLTSAACACTPTAKRRNSNREVSAQAFTHGQDIYLGEGKSDLTSSEGKQSLAHELTHVVQQGGAVARKPVVQRALETEPEAAQEEEQPLSIEAALAEAQAEVTDADIAQEAVTVETTPIESACHQRDRRR